MVPLELETPELSTVENGITPLFEIAVAPE